MRALVLWLALCLPLVSGRHTSTDRVYGRSPRAAVHGDAVRGAAPVSELPEEVDILKLLNLSSKGHGFSPVQGPVPGYSAYKFRSPYTNNVLSNNSTVKTALEDERGFTVTFLYRQQHQSIGTLLAINSPGRLTPWFEVISNRRTKRIIVKYRLNGEDRVETAGFKLPHKTGHLAGWTRLAISFDYEKRVIRLERDCLDTETVPLARGRLKTPPGVLIYFLQEPGRKKKFLGTIQAAKILPYAVDKRLWKCG